MGTSTDAILFYGICPRNAAGSFGGNIDEGFEIYDYAQVEKCLLKNAGIVDTSGLWTKDGDYAIKPGAPGHEEAQAIWKRHHNAKLDFKKELGVDLAYHGRHEFMMPYVCVTESETTAYRGCPRSITSLEVAPGWNEKLKKFCELAEIPYQEPKWWLVSYWG